MSTNKELKIESVEVIPVKAETIDINNMEYIRSNESTEFPDIPFLIKVNIDGEIPTDSNGIELFLEDYPIRKFNQSAQGVFFKVYNPRFLIKHSGKEVFISVGGDDKKATGVNFPKLPDQSSIDNLIECCTDIQSTEALIN